MLHVMIEAPHTLLTLIRSASYIYIVFQHLLLQPVVTRVQPQRDMLGFTVTVVVVGDSLALEVSHLECTLCYE